MNSPIENRRLQHALAAGLKPESVMNITLETMLGITVSGSIYWSTRKNQGLVAVRPADLQWN